MGRIMSFGQDGRMVRDFDKSEHDFLRRYGRTPEEVMDENAKLIVKLNAEHIVRQNVEIENTKLHDEVERLHADQAHWELGNCPSCPNVADLQEALEQNAKLREQTELLVTLLRNDCDIEASWDGLRKFWYIGLTESGCLMRDRACKAEAENTKLRELVVTLMACVSVDDCDKCPINGAEFKVDEVRCCREAKQRMQALGIEVYG